VAHASWHLFRISDFGFVSDFGFRIWNQQMNDFWIYHALFWLQIVCVFLIGSALGSFLNVCAHRLPYEKSVLWPGSHCPSCFQAIRWYDNLPLVGYWLLRGRCRDCGVRFSIRYFLVELFTGLAFAGLFYAEVVRNVLAIPYVGAQAHRVVLGLTTPFSHPRLWLLFAWHATLLSFLIVATLCDLQHMEIPLSVTVTGTVVGLIGATLMAWPFPNDPLPPPAQVSPAATAILGLPPPKPPPPVHGLYAWPVWHPLPDWLPPGSWQLGLATGLAGALAGMLALRGVRMLFSMGRGVEGLGVGDADLMMMAGSFIGWQPVLAAFILGVFPALLFGVAQVIFRGNQEMPFGPSLAVGVVLAVLLWKPLGDHFQEAYFNAGWMLTLVVAGGVLLLVASFILRLTRGTGPAPPK
jgi:leader peptidase (prepilin peptidase)/N-methyltransferase